MKKGLFTRKILGLGVAMAALAVAPAQAAADSCSNPLLTQPFLWAGDSHWYTLAPGESTDNFSATGWQLSGGAKIVTTTLGDGTRGAALDLPAGGKAVSPSMCITDRYPTARTIVRNVSGGWGVELWVTYPGSANTGVPEASGVAAAIGKFWTLSGTMQIHPGSLVGWQQAQFTLVGGGSRGEYQLYDFWVDPRMI